MNCDTIVCILMKILWTLLCLQLFDLSGILTVFFCGIVMAHYTWYNITENSRVTTRYVISDGSFSLIWNEFFFCYTWYRCLWELWNMNQRRKSLYCFSILLLHLQAYFCNIFISLGNFHLPICWYGCHGHWEVESSKQKVVPFICIIFFI